MGITRKMLEEKGIAPEVIEFIISEHIKTVNGVKDERDEYKAKADELEAVKKELETLKKSGSELQKQYSEEHKAFEQYKAEMAAAEITRKKTDIYRAELRKANIPEKIIDALLKIADVELVTLGEDGRATNTADVEKAIKEQFSDYIMTEKIKLDVPDTPPAAPTGKDAFNAMSLAEQMRYANEHPEEVKGYFST